MPCGRADREVPWISSGTTIAPRAGKASGTILRADHDRVADEDVFQLGDLMCAGGCPAKTWCFSPLIIGEVSTASTAPWA